MKPIVPLVIGGILCSAILGISLNQLIEPRRPKTLAPVTVTPPPSPTPSETHIVRYMFTTVRRDGHLGVVTVLDSTYGNTTAMHHPDCPCLKGGRE